MPSDTVPYFVAHASHAYYPEEAFSLLQTHVEELLAEGYICQGGVSIAEKGGRFYVAQAMLKDEFPVKVQTPGIKAWREIDTKGIPPVRDLPAPAEDPNDGWFNNLP